MKLLTPQQLNDKKEADKVRDLIRTKEMADQATKTRKELANAEADFNQALARQRHQWALEVEQKEQVLRELKHEVEELEDRKAKALIPIDSYKEQVDQLLLLAKIAMGKADAKAEENEDLAERLQDKLDEAGAKLQDAQLLEAKLKQREYGITIQGQQVVEGHKDLNKKIAKFNADKVKAETDINERKTALALWERSLVAKDEKLSNKIKELQIWERQLADQRDTLERAFKRISPLEK